MLQLRKLNKAPSSDICVLCPSNDENLDHTFLQCLVTLSMWMILFSIQGEHWVCPRSFTDHHLTIYIIFGKSKGGTELWNSFVFAFMGSTWLEHNSPIFQENQLSFLLLCDKIVFLTSLWCFVNGIFRRELL